MTERDLHHQICQLLDKLGIVYIHSRTDRKTTNAKGTPDFIFAVNQWIGVVESASACAWEVKTAKGKLSTEQLKLSNRMQTRPNYWNFAVIRSLDDAINELKEIGLIT